MDGERYSMEILHDKAEKRTVLLTLDDYAEASNLYRFIIEDYEVIRAYDANECLSVMHERCSDLSAVIIDIDMAEEDDFAFLRTASQETLFDTIPIVVAARRPLTDGDMRCLDEGAIDVMMQPYLRGITIRRIENAIRIKRSTTFYEIETMLRELPSNIFLKDREGRYVFATHYWHHLDTGDDPNWTIRGKTDLEIRKDRENAIKAMKADAEIIRTGKGTTYVIEINTDGIQEFMELIKRPVRDADGNIIGIIALINDVTEAELLKRELERRARTDELTGLQNHRAYDEALSQIPKSDNFPIAVISADCDELKRVNDTYGHIVGDEYIRMAAMTFKVGLPEDSQAFRTGGDEFVALLPHTTKEQADEIVKTMQRQCQLFKLKESEISISYGTAEISGPDDSVIGAISYADRAMYVSKAARRLMRNS